MPDLLTIDEALAAVLERAVPAASEDVAVAMAAGRVLAEPALAACDLPPFNSSAMDGYAVRAADTPGALHVVGQSAAGRPAARLLGAGEAIAISTGAVVPEGADAVVPIEHVVERGDTIEAECVGEGDNVRPRGGDAATGVAVVEPGSRLRPAQLGAIAAVGIATVRCGRQPRVTVQSTGTELRPAGARLEPGQIYESNSVLLAAQAVSAGALPNVAEPVADDEPALRMTLELALESDVLLTSGGVSVGEHDLVRRLLAELGVTEVFWGVAVRPGKPLFFGVRGRTLVFGLPGNPVSSLVSFELFVRPALAALQGLADPAPAFLPGVLAVERSRNPARDDLVRATSRIENGEVLLEPLSGQESHMIARAAAADTLVLVPRGDGPLQARARVSYLPI